MCPPSNEGCISIVTRTDTGPFHVQDGLQTTTVDLVFGGVGFYLLAGLVPVDVEYL